MSNGDRRGWRPVAVVLLLAAAVAGGAELSPEIATDRLLVRAEWQAQEGEHGAALETLNEVLALVEEHGLMAPDAFWFLHAQAASTVGEHAQAVESATRYVTTAGRGGEYYRAALELLETSDRELRALREREAAERAERERMQREEEAWRAGRERREQMEERVEAAYRDQRQRMAGSPAGVGDVFADPLQSGGRGPAMVTIRAGVFQMGCLMNERKCRDLRMYTSKPVHEVTIDQPFALSVYEVTFDEWDACAAAGGCAGYEPSDEDWGRGARPVVGVSWYDAQEYVSWLSMQTGAEYRLPSESEWEYAARAGMTTRYGFGVEIGVNRANCDGCGSEWDDRQTAPVGSFRPNAFGLYDIHGNVREWVADRFNLDYEGAPTDGSAWLRLKITIRVEDRRAVRGGSWRRHPESLLAARRSRVTAGDRGNDLGFRVARTLIP